MKFLFSDSRKYYLRLSEETGFQKDIIEKAHRLIMILEFINYNADLRDNLVLKGGTALNLTLFNLPRLSVDLDFDYHSYENRDKVLQERRRVKEILYEYFQREGYGISQKSKDYFALESIVVDYINNAGNNDNIKLEINYSLRHHIWPTVLRKATTKLFGSTIELRTLNGVELVESKTVALLNRLAARDLYDLYNVAKYKIISEQDYRHFCNAVIFYCSLAGHLPDLDKLSERLDDLSELTIKQELQPMLVKSERFDLNSAKKVVREFLSNSLVIQSNHKRYLEQFAEGNYRPELLFSSSSLENIQKHPMAIWKTMNRQT